MIRKWTREETIIALHTYCRIPFKNSSARHPIVVEMAEKIGRTPAALNMKIGNLGRLDPTLQSKGITGLTHGAQMEEEVWRDFYGHFEDLVKETERILLQLGHIEELRDFPRDFPTGDTREVTVQQRKNQDFFRSAVLSSYNNSCCISALANIELIEACHILPWSENKEHRTNPQNGLCLTRTLHRAYDENLISITPDYKVMVAKKFFDENSSHSLGFKFLKQIDNIHIILPSRFAPSKEFLDYRHSKFLTNI